MSYKEKRDKLEAFNLADIKVTEAYCKNAYEREVNYLEFLKPDCLLAGFRETAGLPKKAMRYNGWEATEIQGHTLGHYLGALSQAYASQASLQIKERIDYICDELRLCQRQDGFLFASPEEIFDRIESQHPAWVPWYTMDKLFEGLLQAYQLGKNQTAYKILIDLGEWVYNRCSSWSEEIHKRVLQVEYGGMNAALYELYQVSGNSHFKEAAKKFDEETLFRPLFDKRDILNGLHANATIPKIIGALKRYLVEGEEYYLKVAQNFWDIVTSNHTYCTGGNSEWEHFGEPNILDRERTACNCETCNVYNMLKLTQMLFEITADKKYGDFYERTWLNAILSSQNPETGMTTYFQPMASGYFKVFGSPDNHFWCCTGTGMENFTKLGDGIYFHDEKAIYINRYLSSHLEWGERNIELDMKAELLDVEDVELRIQVQGNQKVEIYFRIPWWSEGKAKVTADGKEIAYNVVNEYGYMELYGSQEIKIQFSASVHYERLPDLPHSIAFMYGPIVLCAELGKEMMLTTETGVNVVIPTKDFFIKDYLLLAKETVEVWLERLSDRLIRVGNEMKFVLQGTDEDKKLTFRPYFSEYKERYGIYWKLIEKGSTEQAEIEKEIQTKLERSKDMIDCIPVGNDQYELSHQIRGDNTQTSGIEGHRCRFIRGKGWFRYILKWNAQAKYLNVTYRGNDEEEVFDIWINGKLLVQERLNKKVDQMYIQSYEIPTDRIDLQQENIEVIFKTNNDSDFCSIWDELFVSTNRI
ncbi:MAG: hypothetical protein E7231_04840 [Cellulosilyticum sp.]|nr:hypothetical protein [Cellulosilyticum sp.]